MDPAARPSSPSVRFTAFEEDVSITNTQRKKKNAEIQRRRAEEGQARRRPRLAGERETTMANSTETSAVPMNFCAFDKPRERFRRTFR